ncbi:Uncharacterised protein [uncultured archaeon]|nr:Uncharacterised protein [uncultured archaeon]
MHLEEHPIVGRILYRIIRKHIAGTTMSSAIEKAKELNGKSLPVSISFLSDVAKDSSKAKYATTTYLELIRRIGRMGLRASVHVPLSQIGIGVSEEVASRNAREILGTANKYGVFVWFEVSGPGRRMPRFLKEARGMGYAVDVNEAAAYLGKNAGIKSLKVMFTGKAPKKEGAPVSVGVREILKDSKNVVLQSAPESIVKEFTKGKDKKSVSFEFLLGYSKKAIGDLAKKGARTSVYVPFGKDWTQYAIDKVPENYARFLASTLLKKKGSDKV